MNLPDLGVYYFDNNDLINEMKDITCYYRNKQSARVLGRLIILCCPMQDLFVKHMVHQYFIPHLLGQIDGQIT